MSLEETFACYVGAYYGVREMDEYQLKEYVLHDLEHLIEIILYMGSIWKKKLMRLIIMFLLKQNFMMLCLFYLK